MDVSSETIHSLLPAFLVVTLGASPAALGVIEGLAEATASIAKVFSGALSDWLRQRKLLTVVGYGLSALSKPLFPLASSVDLVLIARLVDRIGKGIRGAPRDALIGLLAPAHVRGAAYGLRQSLDTVGAFVGPLLAVVLLQFVTADIRQVFWVSVIPAALAVITLIVGVKEPTTPPPSHTPENVTGRWQFTELGRAYWQLVAIATVVTLARFSEAFLLLRAQQAGIAIAFVPFVLIVMNVVYSLSSYPAGAISDRGDRLPMLAVGFGTLIVADLILGTASSPTMILVGVGVWGLHMGLTQGLLASLIADTTAADRRGTAFGVFYLITGVATLAASVLAGLLWERFGATATFLTGALLVGVGLLWLVVWMFSSSVREEK